MTQATFETQQDQYEEQNETLLFLAAIDAMPDHKSANKRKQAQNEMMAQKKD